MQSTEIGGGDHLPQLATGMLRDVAHSARLGRDPGDGVSEPMRAVCRSARLCGLRVEQLLVVLKDAWRRLPEARRLDRYEADEVLARVIQDCITEYYDDARQPAGSADSRRSCRTDDDGNSRRD